MPSIASLSPNISTSGGPGLFVTVDGNGFVAGSQVQWNGGGRTTTFVSAGQLTAALSAADIATPGSPR